MGEGEFAAAICGAVVHVHELRSRSRSAAGIIAFRPSWNRICQRFRNARFYFSPSLSHAIYESYAALWPTLLHASFHYKALLHTAPEMYTDAKQLYK